MPLTFIQKLEDVLKMMGQKQPLYCSKLQRLSQITLHFPIYSQVDNLQHLPEDGATMQKKYCIRFATSAPWGLYLIC